MAAVGQTIETAMQVVDKIITVLADVPTEVTLTGELRADLRRQGSNLEDIVVSAVYLSSNQMQVGTFNVNIHVPTLKGLPAIPPNQLDNTQPNRARMEQIAQACVAKLNENYLFDCMVDLGNGGEPIRDGNNWFYNLSVTYYSPRVDVGT